MAAVLMRLRTELRPRVGATVALILLLGVAGGVVLASAAGARRTETAFPRLLATTHAGDALIVAVSPQGRRLTGLYRTIERLPEVDRAGEVLGPYLFHLTSSGQPDPEGVGVLASVDGRGGYSIEGSKIIEGRMPRPDRPLEALANRFMAERFGVHPGSRVTFLSFKGPLPDDPSQIKLSSGTRLTFTITGVGIAPYEVVPVSQTDSGAKILVTPAYMRTYSDPNYIQFDSFYVRLNPGSDMRSFHRDVDALVRSYKGPAQYFFADQTDHNAREERAMRPQWIALVLFAALAGAAALLALGQILSRQLFVGSTEYPILRGLGMTSRDLVTVAMLRVAIIGAAGAAIAVAIAFVASPLFPVGPARLAEPSPGFSADIAFLGFGFIAIVLSLMAVGVYPVWRGATAPAGILGMAEVRGAEHPSRVAAAATHMTPSPSMASGVRMALEPGHGRTSVPVRTALAGLIAAMAAVAAAFTFATSLNRLVDTPRLYGWNWDVFMDAGFGAVPPAGIRVISADRAVAALSAGTYGENGTVTIAGKVVAAVGIQPIEGSVFPTIVEGRPPLAGDEIVLGAATLRAAHASVGHTVMVSVNGKLQAMRIVGQAVFPSMGRGALTPTSLGEGALLTASELAPPGIPPEQSFNFLLIHLKQGADRSAFERRLEALAARIDPSCRGAGACTPRPLERPTDIANYARVRATPLILAGLLALIATAMIGHALVTSVRRRRHDLAILKTLGFVRRQVSATVAWQATTFAVIALLLGLPIGVAIGRWIWTAFANQLGVPSQPTVNVPIVLLAIPAILLLANLIAAVPGRLASKTEPAAILRAE
jgi:putative ABC transport system permease protein